MNPKNLKQGQFCKHKGRIYQMDDGDYIQQLTGKEKGKAFWVEDDVFCPQEVTPIKIKITEVK